MKCKCCGEPCEIVRIDYGRGRTECFGVVSTEIDIRELSACCYSDLMDEDWKKPKEDEDEDVEKTGGG